MKSHVPVDIHSEAFLNRLLSRQLRLSVSCAAAFAIVLLGMPLANFLFPEFMATPVLGFTLSWLILGLGVFPVVWVIAFLFIRRSVALEEQAAAEALRATPKPAEVAVEA